MGSVSIIETTLKKEHSIKNFYVEINKGGDHINGHETWIHPKLAIQLAQWISPLFALQVSDWIIELFTYGHVEINKIVSDQQKEIKRHEQKIQVLQDQHLKKQSREQFSEGNVIYIVTTEDNKKRRIYIIGKATDLTERLSIYNKTAEHQVVYYKGCLTEFDMDAIEKIVLLKLEKYREKANRDRVVLPRENDISLFTSIIDQSIDFYYM